MLLTLIQLRIYLMLKQIINGCNNQRYTALFQRAQGAEGKHFMVNKRGFEFYCYVYQSDQYNIFLVCYIVQLFKSHYGNNKPTPIGNNQHCKKNSINYWFYWSYQIQNQEFSQLKLFKFYTSIALAINRFKTCLVTTNISLMKFLVLLYVERIFQDKANN